MQTSSKKVINNYNAKELTSTQKRVAHMLVMGATVNMVATELKLPSNRIEYWTWQKRFLLYMAKLEKRFYTQLEKQTLELRRAAYRVLRDKLTSEDPYEQRWAVDKILHATEDKTLNLNIEQHTRIDERPALSDDAKEGAKRYLQEVRHNNEQALSMKPGEA